MATGGSPMQQPMGPGGWSVQPMAASAGPLQMATGGLPLRPVKHRIFFRDNCLLLSSHTKEMRRQLDSLHSRSDQFELYCIYSNPPIPLEMLVAPPNGWGLLLSWRDARDVIKKKRSVGDVVIICGAVKQDLYLAAHTKSFLIAAGWVNPEPEDEVKQYGIPAPTPRKMKAIIDIVVNQRAWYYSCTFDNPVPTKVVSLCLANTLSPSLDPDEREMAKAFQAILKNGADNPAIKQALACYLLAAIAHDAHFREVQDWAVAPSSSTEPNQNMVELKERVQCMMYGRKPEPIFIRHTATTKSRIDKKKRRAQNDYCLKHFRTIRVNEAYRKKLKGRIVCVIDDYLTWGNTFETLRNLLVACKVKEIIFVSIGKFKQNDENVYIQKNFSIDGDVHTANYTAIFDSDEEHTVTYDDDAQRSLRDLKELANHLQ